MQKELVLPSPAKLNLFLHIIGRRADGYHNLQTLFQFLDFGDQMTLTSCESGIDLVSNLEGVEPENNLIVKAVRLLQQEIGCSQGVKIELKKQLPVGGGLGGGSSNAATTLLALNALWGLGLDIDELAALGLKLGADVPVLVRGHSAFAEGVGEVLTPLDPKEYWFLVVTPDVQANTPELYRHSDLIRDTAPIEISDALDPLSEQRKKNDFEPLVRSLYPEVDKVLELLDNLSDSDIGPARMSGSGASVFARFSSREQAQLVQDKLPDSVVSPRITNYTSTIRSFVARGINTSPVHTALKQAGFEL